MKGTAAPERTTERGGRADARGDAEWPRVALAEVVDFIRGVTFDKTDAKYQPVDGHIPILRAGNIGDGLTLDNDLVWVPPERVDEDQLLRVGDLAICMSSGSPAVVGKTAQLREPWRGSVGAFCGIIRPRPHVHPDFVALWFRAGAFREWRDGQSRGANIQNLRFSQFAALEMPLPPLAEQERIAGWVSRGMERASAARRAALDRLAAAETLPAALLREVFEGPEASGWETVRFGDLVVSHDDRREPVRSIDRKPGPYPYYGASGIIDRVDRFIFDGEYLLVAEDGANLVARATPIAFVARGQFWVNNHAHVVQPKDPQHLDFLVSYFAWLDIADFVTGSAQPKLNQAVLHDLPVPLPPKTELPRLAAELTKKLAAAEGVIARCREELAAIEALPAALLRQAFGGSEVSDG